MRSARRFFVAFLAICVIGALTPVLVAAQGRGRGGAPPHPQGWPPIQLRAQVFIGGYFYDPSFGRYPWWLPGAYPYRYLPRYDRRAILHVNVSPREAAVYVDGFYAGIVDDFDGFFQGLPLTPGTHDITLYLDGFRTLRRWLYLGPQSTMHLHAALERLRPGERSEPPNFAPPLPPPPPGSYQQPRTAPPLNPPDRTEDPNRAEGYGTLDLQVMPMGAAVTIDGQTWQSADGRRFVIETAAGRHHVEVTLTGYRTFSTDVDIRDGEVTPINVSLTKGGTR
jgi:hypothetical protein